MRFLHVILALLVLALGAAIQAQAGTLFSRSVVPRGWTMKGPAPAFAPVRFIVALKQRNLAQLESIFWAVSDPMHVDYQKFMKPAEIHELVAPEASVTEKVVSYLLAHGVDQKSILVRGDSIEVLTTVKRAQSIFHTKYFSFVHDASRKVLHKAWGSYSLPDHIHEHVSFVEGVSTFPMPRLSTAKKAIKSPEQNTQLAVPQFTALRYQLPALSPLANPTTTQGVIEYEGQYFANSDTTLFNNATAQSVPLIASSNIVGSNDDTSPGVEASLDVEWQGAVNPTATQWFWIEAGETWLYGWAVHFLNTTTVPQVTSTSYGWWEGDQCDVTDECSTLGVDSTGYVQRVNVEFQKIGVAGTSILVASGDSGANGRTNPDCSVPQLRPAFPASSPYVTSVGATEIRSPVYNLTNAPSICTGNGYSCEGGGVEAAVSYTNSFFTSGGGFSNISLQPSYQSAAVAAYFASGVTLPPASYYNASGRGAPDVSALGQNGFIFSGGESGPVSGTSMSSPIFSGVISLLNVAAIAASGKPLGFLNPILYQIAASNPAAFHDVTLGDNICTEDGCSSGCQGYYATKGWDPVTGLGSPNYEEMLASVQSIFAMRKAKGML